VTRVSFSWGCRDTDEIRGSPVTVSSQTKVPSGQSFTLVSDLREDDHPDGKTGL
jgi:hypothetical protein